MSIFFNQRFKLFLTILLFSFLFTIVMFPILQKEDEKNLQFGFGINIGSNNINDFYGNLARYEAIENGSDYSYPGTSDSEQDKIQNLGIDSQRDILLSHVLRSMEYGITFRILCNILMLETDLIYLSSNNDFNGRLDLTLNAMIGFRTPYFIMLYLLVGPNITVGFDYNNYGAQETELGWVNAIKNNISFNIGYSLRLGLDFKFKYFSFGGYYEYTVKNFSEYVTLYNQMVDSNISKSDIIGDIIKNQSRIGITFIWYTFSKGNDNNKEEIK